MEKAVRLADDDPELHKTLGEQMEFDAQIIDVIHFIKPPDDLRQKLNDLGEKPREAKARLRSQCINPAWCSPPLSALIAIIRSSCF